MQGRSQLMYKLGIDVGGTNTDAVLIDENLKVIASVKRHTTPDAYDGIVDAVRSVLEASGVDRKEIGQAMLGTTQCTNAIVERKRLAPIGVLRIGAPATVGIPPMVDWAEDLKAVAVETAVIGGGFEYDGKELAPFDAAACGVWLHGYAADRCSARKSRMAMLPHDILEDLGTVLAEEGL